MITIKNPEKYVAGLYTRLSNEKIEAGNSEVLIENEDERESGSISTQKAFLNAFCRENKIRVFDTYVDDGVSGATFDRPDFNRLIHDIEKKKVNLVLVKDLSRFGRLSSKISYYLEEFFIEKGVRFIAISDDIDTGHIETSEEMMQFKAFFNEWYVRDTSRKVRNGKKIRAKEGKVMTTYPTYGYKKDPKDCNHYVIDPDVAPIIQDIFRLAKEGKTATQIANILTQKKVLLPSEIVGNAHTRKGAIKRGWNRNTVNRILQNVTYLGWVSNGNTKKINYKSKKTMIMPKENRIVVKNMHTPIIDLDTFELVQEMIETRRGVRTKNYDWLLKGILYCRECGKKMSIIPQRRPDGRTLFYFRCNTYASNPAFHLCTPHSSNLEKTTNEVLSIIKKKCKEILDQEKVMKIAQNKETLDLKNEIIISEKKVLEINSKIDELYSEKFKGMFDDDDFQRIYSNLKKERSLSEERVETLKKRLGKQESTDEIKKIIKNFYNCKEVTKLDLISLVDRIEITEDKRISIHYKYNILNQIVSENLIENVG